MTEKGLPDVAKKILEYLRHHPEAKDTLDGVAQWWLKKSDIYLVREALAELTRMRLIGKRETVSGEFYFRESRFESLSS